MNIAECIARICSLGRVAPIDVVVANNIVFVEIGPRLDFDEESRNLAWIGKPVLRANGDIS